MSSNADSPEEPHVVQARWYQNPIWLLPIAIIVLAFWMSRLFSGQAPTPAAAPPGALAKAPAPVDLATEGSNLLKDPALRTTDGYWTAYHNAQPMHVSKLQIGLANAKNSVQEVYQLFAAPPGPLIVKGRVRVSGAPLPQQATAIVMLVDTSNRGTTVFSISSKNGVGSFPFAVRYVPSGAANEFVVGVITAKDSNDKTDVSFSDLDVSKAAK